MNKPTTLQTVTTAMLTAFGLILPQVFHFLGNAGTLFSPMHLPVLLCGLICGAFMGGICGLLTPILSCLLFSMPPFPYVIPMTFELIAYGIISGLLGNLFAKIENTKNFATILSLVISMILGRIINAFASAIMALFTVSDSAF
ncbi:MAG: ECF transporter S component, partial [Clostridia bacterium]